MDFTTLESQVPTNLNDMYLPTKVDIFIIKAYKIITNGTILNSNHITTSTTAADLNNDDNDSQSTMNGNGKTGRRRKKITAIHPQYAKTFVKISKIYNSLISSGLLGDVSTSPKSDIELFQRFQQNLKELGLNFNMSPYSKYFNKINDTLFQVKEDSEFDIDDPYWTSLSTGILNFYNPRTDKMINQGRKKNNLKKTVSNNNHNANNNDFFNINNSVLDDPNFSFQLHRKLQMVPQEVSSRSLNGYYTQPTSPGSGGFQFNLGTTAEEELMNNNFNGTNGMNAGNSANNNNGTNIADNNSNMMNNNQSSNYNYLNHKKRRSLGSLNFDDNTMEDLFKFTNLNKKPKTPVVFNNVIDEFRFPSNNQNDTCVNDKENILLDETQSEKKDDTKDIMRNDSNNNSLLSSIENELINNNDKNNNPGTVSSTHTNTNINSTDTNRMNTMQITPESNTNNNEGSNTSNINLGGNTVDSVSSVGLMNDNGFSGATNTSTINTSATSSSTMDIYLQEINSKYGLLITEKDNRIKSLENELESQRQETLWLRKLLIEDMGYIRTYLQKIQK